MSTPVPVNLRAGHRRAPLVLNTGKPSLTWTYGDVPPGFGQSAYELEATVAGRSQSSGWIDSSEHVRRPWPFAPLASRERATVRVRIRGEDGGRSEWSAPAELEAGLFGSDDWIASAITDRQFPPDRYESFAGRHPRPPLLRREFTLAGPVVHARLYVAALGLAEVRLNGRRVGSDDLFPGWTSYLNRVHYATYDVADLLRPGANAIGALLGDGWYRGRFCFNGGRQDIYGHAVTLIAQLEVCYEDGRRDVVTTDPGWRTASGPIISSGLYEGEVYDARDERDGWDEPGFDDAGWDPVEVLEYDPGILQAPEGRFVTCTQEIEPVSVTPLDGNRLLLDFGQNFAGRLRIRVAGQAGTRITLNHAEVLQDGDLCIRPLRLADAQDTYVMAGGGERVWEPRFTIHGFRYATVTGWPGTPGPGDIVARVLHSDMEPTGGFYCGDERVARLHENVLWSMRSNFVSIPTDCPQRDERVGWTGDIQVFAPTATFLYDCAGFLSSWLQDLAAEQLRSGTVPVYIPYVDMCDIWSPPRPVAVWGDAAVLVPWAVYERYGDLDVLRRQFDSAQAWVDLVTRVAGPSRLWDTGFQLGDWLDPTAPPENPEEARTDARLVATAYFARSARTLARIAGALGRDDDATRYQRLADEVGAAFRAAYLREGGLLTSDAPTAYALAIAFGLLGEEDAAAAGRRLAAHVRDGEYRIATGFAGTPVILEALTMTGHAAEAVGLLLCDQCPSWLYQVRLGGTTIWERWDSLLPDGTVNPGEMTSFNHYALGSVAQWLHERLAGLRSAAPGGAVWRIEPVVVPALGYAGAWLDSEYGRASSSWRVDGDRVLLDVTVPATTRATVLFGSVSQEVGPGDHVFTQPLAAVVPAASVGA